MNYLMCMKCPEAYEKVKKDVTQKLAQKFIYHLNLALALIATFSRAEQNATAPSLSALQGLVVCRIKQLCPKHFA